MTWIDTEDYYFEWDTINLRILSSGGIRVWYIAFEDERYKTLVVQGSFGSHGYSVHHYTGELERVCICAAWNSSECCCGGFDNV